MQFLINYEDELRTAVKCNDETYGKGKKTVQRSGDKIAVNLVAQWTPPIQGVAKISTDATFLAETDESAVGRDH